MGLKPAARVQGPMPALASHRRTGVLAAAEVRTSLSDLGEGPK